MMEFMWEIILWCLIGVLAGLIVLIFEYINYLPIEIQDILLVLVFGCLGGPIFAMVIIACSDLPHKVLFQRKKKNDEN